MLQIQFIAYNSDLYKSMADAIQVPYGIAIIAVFVEVRRREKSIVDERSSHELYGCGMFRRILANRCLKTLMNTNCTK